MKRLPNTKLTTQELDLLIEDNLFNYGGEAIICKNNNPHSLYKIFVYPGSTDPERMSDNKLKKVTHYYHNDISGLVKPLSTLEHNGILIGYETTYDEAEMSLLDCCLTSPETVSYLEQGQDLLNYFATQDITYGDVTPDNLLVNRRTNQVKFCDIDNTRVGAYPIDVMSYGLTEYYEETGSMDASADVYMHNLLTLEQLYFPNMTYNRIVRQLRLGKGPNDVSEEAKRIIDSMRYPTSFTGEYVLPHIKQKIR